MKPSAKKKYIYIWSQENNVNKSVSFQNSTVYSVEQIMDTPDPICHFMCPDCWAALWKHTADGI